MQITFRPCYWLYPFGDIAAASQQAGHGNILIQFFPVQAVTAQLKPIAFGRRGLQEARKPRQRHTKRTPVGQIDPHSVFVKVDASC
jgi:hypothetical protein